MTTIAASAITAAANPHPPQLLALDAVGAAKARDQRAGIDHQGQGRER
jgi:hypothetical protein